MQAAIGCSLTSADADLYVISSGSIVPLSVSFAVSTQAAATHFTSADGHAVLRKRIAKSEALQAAGKV